MDSRRLEGSHLLRGSSLSSGNDRAGVSHPSSWRCGLPGNEADDGFADILFDEFGCLFLGIAADLTDHHDPFRLGVLFEHFETINEIGPIDRIPTDADAA